MALLPAEDEPKTEFIAHRGSSYLAPENTLAAFQLGWRETGACELDVRATADGKLVVMHDASALRTTGIDATVARHTLVQLQGLDAGAWKGKEWKGERVPLLEEVIAAMPANKRLLIEMKCGCEAVPELARVVRESGRASALTLICFDLATCVEGKKVLPDLPVHLLIQFRKKGRAWQPPLSEVLAVIRREGLDGLGANDAPVLNAVAVEEIRRANLRLNIWTVDEVAAAKRLAGLGVNGIITNRPGWLKAALSKKETVRKVASRKERP